MIGVFLIVFVLIGGCVEEGRINVSSNPSGADVSIDGTYQGISELVVTQETGSHIVRVTKTGFRPYETLVTVEEGQTNTVYANLKTEENWHILREETVTIPVGQYASFGQYLDPGMRVKAEVVTDNPLVDVFVMDKENFDAYYNYHHVPGSTPAVTVIEVTRGNEAVILFNAPLRVDYVHPYYFVIDNSDMPIGNVYPIRDVSTHVKISGYY